MLLLIAKPPHTHVTICDPITGIAVIILVITVAPQKLIWPHGNVYPKNATPDININKITPVDHTACFGARYD